MTAEHGTGWTRHPDKGDDVTLTVFEHGATIPHAMTFPRTSTVGAAAAAAAAGFGLEPRSPSFQLPTADVVDPDVSLAEAGIGDGESVEIVDTA